MGLLHIGGVRPGHGARVRTEDPGGAARRRGRGPPASGDTAGDGTLIEHVFRREWGPVLSSLVGFLGDIELAEEATQEAFAIAAERWPREGSPEHPVAWLVATGRNRAIDRLMRQNGIQGAKRRGKPWRTTRADPAALRSPDRVKRDFTASRPDEKWFADFTYLRCWEGLVFFSFVIDAYSRRIVGWQFASHMRTDLVLDALRMALHQRAPGADVSLVAHSDAGSQYTSFDYTQTLDDAGVLGSIGTIGDAYDNAAAESFVDTFKTELIADRSWTSRSQLELAIVKYVAWFNNERIHENLNDRPPREIEELYAVKREPTIPIKRR